MILLGKRAHCFLIRDIIACIRANGMIRRRRGSTYSKALRSNSRIEHPEWDIAFPVGQADIKREKS